MKIELKPNQNLFFTSDTHYNHTNICRGVSQWKNDDITRPFDTLEKMNERIIAGINSAVGQDDILIHLGDWSFGGFENIEIFRNRINCKNIHLILGNHDHHIEKDKNGIKSLFASVNEYLRLEVKMSPSSKMIPARRYTFILMHYPIASWHNMSDGVIHLHGHVHLPPNKKLSAGKAMDVGVDGNNMDPYSLNEIVRIMHQQPIAKLSIPQDHHEKNTDGGSRF